jgi:predicted extracellular nuclease
LYGSALLTGFFVQEEDSDADADPNTSEGIYVYCGTLGSCPASLAVGDLVVVSGIAEEFFDMSQIDTTETGGSITIEQSGVALPTPTMVTLPAVGSTKDASTFEQYEGMLVSFSGTLVVSEYFNLARFGEVVLTKDTRPYQFTHSSTPDVSGYAAFLADLATRRIILDDDRTGQNVATSGTDMPYAYPLPGGLSLTNKFRGGDTIDDLTGVLQWSFDAWRVRPSGDGYSFASVNPNPITSGVGSVGAGATLKVASFNVLNYFTDFGVRGADSQNELDRQRAKIVAAMQGLDADIVGLVEIQNNDAAIIDLVNGINAAMGAGIYDYLDTGAIGTDQIKVAFIYKPATVRLLGNCAILDSSVDPNFIDDKNRPALIQTFQEIVSGEKLTIAVNHFKSKGSSCGSIGDPNLNDGQANCQQTREDAAIALASYLATDPTSSGGDKFLIIGDLNAYKMEDAIQALVTAGYTDLIDLYNGEAGYSYVFDGQLGYLDHALANGPLLAQVTGVSEWHINADEVPLFDYNDCIEDASEQSFERKSCNPDLYDSTAIRASDHDPVLIGFAFSVLCSAQQLTVQKATASSVESNHFVADWAVDGKSRTRWASDGPIADNAPETQWLELDLGGFRFIDSINLQWERAYSRDYKIQVSADGIVWETVSTFPDGEGGEVLVSMLESRGQYVRIYSLKGDPNYGISLFEVKIFGDVDGDSCVLELKL